MATTVEELEIRVNTLEAEKKVKGFEKSLTGSFIKGQVAAQALTKAFDLLSQQFSQGIKAAIDYQKTTAQLTTSLKKAGDTNLTWLNTLNKQAAALQRVTGHSDEVIRRLQSMAITAGVSTNDVGKLIEASVSLSNAMGVELESAFRNLIKTQSGMTGELGELLPAVKNLTKEQLEAGGAIDLINESMGDQLSLMTEGVGGAALGLTNAWADLQEKFALAAVEVFELDRSMRALATSMEVVSQQSGRGFFDFLSIALGGGDDILREQEATMTAGAVGRVTGLGGAPRQNFRAGRRGRRGRRRGGGGGGGGGLDFAGGPGLFGEGATLVGNEFLSQEQVEQVAERARQMREAVEIESSLAAEAGKSAFTRFSSAGTDALVALASGASVSLKKVAAAILVGLGKEMVARGTADILKGTSISAASFGLDPRGPALIAIGKKEIAFGAGLAVAGGLASRGGGAVGGGSTGGAGDVSGMALQAPRSGGGGSGGGNLSGENMGFSFEARRGLEFDPGKGELADGREIQIRNVNAGSGTNNGDVTIVINGAATMDPATLGRVVQDGLSAAAEEDAI